MSDMEVTIRVVDFAKMPGARTREDGDNSAQEFFEDHLSPVANGIFNNSSRGKLKIDLDDTYGYASSFISELAKLIRIHYGSVKNIKKRVLIKSDQDSGLIEKFWNEYKRDYTK